MLGESHFPLGKNRQNSIQNFQKIHSNSLHAQERVVDMMRRMALARLVDSCKLFFNFRLLSAFDSFWRVINIRNGDLCC